MFDEKHDFLQNQVTPISWNYLQNVRCILPIPNPSDEKTSTQPTAEVPIRPNLEIKSIHIHSPIPEVGSTNNNQENLKKNQELPHPNSRGNANAEN